MDLEQFLQQQFLSNTLENYCWLIGFILFGLIFKKIISKYLSKILYKLLNRDPSINLMKFDDLLIKPIGFFILLVFIYLGSQYAQQLSNISKFHNLCFHICLFLNYKNEEQQ